MIYRLATAFITLSTGFAAPALADVNAADFWSNQQAFYGALGATLSGDMSGDQLNNPEINVILPQGIVSFQIKADNVTMTDNSDGTVTINYPSPMTISIAGGVADEGGFSATATMTHDGYTVTASGEPGDIFYEFNGQNMQLVIGDISVDGAEPEGMNIEGWMTLTDWIGTTRVTEGNLITYSASSEIGTTNVDFSFSADNVSSQSSQITLPMTSAIEMTLPSGGSDVLNLSTALRDGLSVVLQSTGEGCSSSAVTMMDGALLTNQTTSTGPQDFDLTFNDDGLAVTGSASDFTMVLNDPMMFPGDLEFGIDAISLDYDVPLNASDAPQDFRVATGLSGITISDAIWDMFDPSRHLPRDTAEILFDVTGMGTNGMDLLNFEALAQLFGPPPIQIDEVTIENLRIAAVGAEATATGAITFDWTDFQTIPGIARPEGAVTVNLNGANALMDTLVAMGLIPEGDLVMPRMMMGMFATPVGDDMLESVLEVNSEGHVLANGQRLQ
ncbi:hypothetical protein OAN307_c47230 [Octadecabacter antarcticus 307]|uniref:DUF2125 domain-containing protein n=1 Tax=Octadecabacter antarcticus 307 TaxID=391626 RepID=M9RBV1_9RHOB|nr:DUF2125 domain-containing protein [Octadecabacter antarcticus]AGI70069.1 hypothetical protein OAN307_c47230 [Octadecabacter antarcticus 307]